MVGGRQVYFCGLIFCALVGPSGHDHALRKGHGDSQWISQCACMDGKNEVTGSEESSSREAVDIQSVNIIIEPYILHTWSRMFIISRNILSALH